jgi:hypothetical protein
VCSIETFAVLSISLICSIDEKKTDKSAVIPRDQRITHTSNCSHISFVRKAMIKNLDRPLIIVEKDEKRVSVAGEGIHITKNQRERDMKQFQTINKS